MVDTGHWDIAQNILHKFKSWDDPDDKRNVTIKYYGFLYIIVNKITGRKYIGKKCFAHKRILRRKTKRTKIKYVDSGWKSYKGSCKSLLDDIELYGPDNFNYTIISLHKTKADLGYAESNLLHKLDVMCSDEYYNANISGIKYRIVDPDNTQATIKNTLNLLCGN